MFRLQLHEAAKDPRIVDLADGRSVFFPGGRDGRAYHVQTRAQAEALERQLEWVRHGSNVAALVVIAAFYWFRDWRLLVCLAPAILGPFVAQRIVARGLPEVTDPVTLRNVGAQAPANVSWSSIVVFSAAIGVLFMFRDDLNSHTMLQVAVGVLILVVAVLHWLRRQGVRRQRAVFDISDPPDNKPIVPR